MIRVLIVDDSAFTRKVLTDIFNAEPDFSVIDTARNGKDAVEKAKKHKPDLITMDVEMPVLDGISALESIMRDNPTPVIMISSLTQSGADATIKALELGAVDFVAKTAGPIPNIAGLREQILEKSRNAAKTNVSLLRRPLACERKPVVKPVTQAIPPAISASGNNEMIVAIGTSTGGPRALQEILTKLPGTLPCSVVIVQHMPPGFTKSLAERLNSLSAVAVKEAEHNEAILPGCAYIAPGDYHMRLDREGDKTVIKLDQTQPINGHRPAVDPMMESVAKLYGRGAVGVILTGMGHDGARGLCAINQNAGYTIAEDQSTAVVFGMPKSAIEMGAVAKIIPLQQIHSEIVRILQRKSGGV